LRTRTFIETEEETFWESTASLSNSCRKKGGERVSKKVELKRLQTNPTKYYLRKKDRGGGSKLNLAGIVNLKKVKRSLGFPQPKELSKPTAVWKITPAAEKSGKTPEEKETCRGRSVEQDQISRKKKAPQ